MINSQKRIKHVIVEYVTTVQQVKLETQETWTNQIRPGGVWCLQKNTDVATNEYSEFSDGLLQYHTHGTQFRPCYTPVKLCNCILQGYETVLIQ